MFLQWLWRVWKWLLRLFTGHCELERLCYQKHQPHQLAIRIGKVSSIKLKFIHIHYKILEGSLRSSRAVVRINIL